ncbi:MAG: low temperature requirement protein A, partial [Actinobacteria bacterium]|nr:low temperature requirement protein A [Actinomycetota bacterium]
MIYLLSQAIYFRVETGSGWMPRVTGATLLGGAATAAYWLPPYAVVVLLVLVLLALSVHLSRDTPDTPVTATP